MNVGIEFWISYSNSVYIFFVFDAGGFKFWRNLSFFVGLPAVGLCMLNAYLGMQQEHTHRPDFVKYDYLRVRTKVILILLFKK